MTQQTTREQLAAMRLEDFKAHLRTIAGEDPKRDQPRAPAASIAGTQREACKATATWTEKAPDVEVLSAKVTARNAANYNQQ